MTKIDQQALEYVVFNHQHPYQGPLNFTCCQLT